MTPGARIKSLRIKLDMNQTQLATAAGISQQRIAEYENGIRSFRRATVDTAYKIAVALETTIEDLISG